MNLADQLNLHCQCRTLSAQELQRQLETEPSQTGLTATLAQSHPHLFSNAAVFLDPTVYAILAQAVATLERVLALPAYQALALAQAPAIAQHHFGPAGVFMGYDFHIGDTGPHLIEINTNAGGAFINAALARSHLACCAPMQEGLDVVSQGVLPEVRFAQMFQAEWQAQRGNKPLAHVLIVDDSPATQYLAPEFEMARQFFSQQGWQAVIADPSELQWDGHTLRHSALPGNQVVDLVYNRLTDFDLSELGHQALRLAYEAGAVVLTPHPRAHAIHANKRNLVTLSDPTLLAQWGVSEADRQLLTQVVPHTQLVTPESADALWAQRRQLFFKPLAGYGGKAAYRGEKLTRKVWAEIVAGHFIAQALVPPSERLVDVDGVPTQLKLDVRAYSYQGQVQLLAARTYQGQTTNFRTPGGGFSPVVVLPAAPARSL